MQAYMTGEISEYNWHDSIESNVHFYAGGHHATERGGVLALKSLLEKEFNLECVFFDSLNLCLGVGMRWLIIFIISLNCFGMTKNEATWKKKQKEASKYYELKNYEAAAEIFQEMIFLVPYETTALYNLGVTLYHAKDYQAAKTTFSKLVRSQSEISVMGNYWLARIYAKEGKIRAAIASVGLGLQNPNIPKSIYQMFLDLVELFKDETEKLLNQGRVYYERARENNDTTLMVKALESLQLAWTLEPKDTTTKKIVQCYLFLKDEATAQKLIASVDDQEIRKELVVDLTVNRQQISKNQVLRKLGREEPPKFNSNFYLHMGQDSNPQTVKRGINVKSQTSVNGILSIEGKVKHTPEYSFWVQGNLGR